MNLTPWGGPTARAASALQVDQAIFCTNDSSNDD
jgi:Mg2+/citrate symporter